MTLKTEYQYIKFEESDPVEGWTTRMWDCLNGRQGTRLGFVAWERSWRQYIFQPDGDCIFSRGCLLDIADFLNQANAMQRHRKD